MKSVRWGYSICLRMCASNMTSSSQMIDERTEVCVLANYIFFLSEQVNRQYRLLSRGGDVCLYSFDISSRTKPVLKVPLLCSTRWTVSCLDSLPKLALKIVFFSFTLPFIEQHKALQLWPASKSHQYADRGLPHIWTRGLASCHSACPPTG